VRAGLFSLWFDVFALWFIVRAMRRNRLRSLRLRKLRGNGSIVNDAGSQRSMEGKEENVCRAGSRRHRERIRRI
jgi:hypothetical protein